MATTLMSPVQAVTKVVGKSANSAVRRRQGLSLVRVRKCRNDCRSLLGNIVFFVPTMEEKILTTCFSFYHNGSKCLIGAFRTIPNSPYCSPRVTSAGV